MITIQLVPTLTENDWNDIDGAPMGEIDRIGRVPNATVNGSSGVLIVIELPEGGGTVVGRTTFKLFETAYLAMKAAEDRDKG